MNTNNRKALHVSECAASLHQTLGSESPGGFPMAPRPAPHCCSAARTSPFAHARAPRSRRTTSPGVQRAPRAEKAGTSAPRSPSAAASRRVTGGAAAVAREGADLGSSRRRAAATPAWTCPGAEVFRGPWGAGRKAATRPTWGTMLNMWKVRELVDKA
jgi:hypothetical protein